MRPVSDYEDEMSRFTISEADIERLLTGRVPDDPALSRVAVVLDDLQNMGRETPRLEVGASDLAAAVPPVPAISRKARPAPRWRLIPRMAGALATLTILIGMTGVAVAADASAPGSPLHGLDLALERVGIGAGGTTERLAEAKALVSSDRPAEALEHARQVVSEKNESAASEALTEAAERVRAATVGGGHPQVSMKEEVAAILDWMETATVEGKDFGQEVAERARQLGNGQGRPDDPGKSGQAKSEGANNGQEGKSGQAPKGGKGK